MWALSCHYTHVHNVTVLVLTRRNTGLGGCGVTEAQSETEGQWSPKPGPPILRTRRQHLPPAHLPRAGPDPFTCLGSLPADQPEAHTQHCCLLRDVCLTAAPLAPVVIMEHVVTIDEGFCSCVGNTNPAKETLGDTVCVFTCVSWTSP